MDQQLAGNTVLNKFYATIVDEGGLQARTDTLLQLEKHMANALGVTTSGELATRLNLKLDNPDLNMVYPEFDMDKPIDSPEGQKIELSDEELELQKQQRLQAGEKSLAVDADITAQKRISEAEKLVKGEKKLKQAERIKGELKSIASETKTKTLLKNKETRRKNLWDTIKRIADTDGIKQAVVGTIGTAGVVIADKAIAAAVPAGKALGALGPAGGPALEAVGIAATAYDINRLRKMPSEQFVPEQVRSFLDESEFVKEGQRAKSKRIALESTGLAPGGFDPSLGQAGRMAFPTREEQMAKDLYAQQKEEQRQKIQSSLGESFRVGSNSFLNTN